MSVIGESFASRLTYFIEDIQTAINRIEVLETKCSALQTQIGNDDSVLRASVPEHWKGCTYPVGAVQSYIAELETKVKDLENRLNESI